MSLENPEPVSGVEHLSTPGMRLLGIRKSFGQTEILHGIDLEIPAGSFVGLVGPNGAGKSTLIKLLAGVHAASAGSIELDGVRVTNLADNPRVGFVHQDLGLVGALSVADNLWLGRRPNRHWSGLLHHSVERARTVAALARVNLEVDVERAVAELSPGEQALVAVARVLDLGARILIVDEATSTLAPADSQLLLRTLRDLTSHGATVVMTTHKLNEIIEVTDRVVVLVDGEIVRDQPTAGLDIPTLVGQMTSRQVESGRSAEEVTAGDVVLELVAARTVAAGPIDLELRRGQVVGLTGDPGSGAQDIAYLACGHVRLTVGSSRHAADMRVALVPPHRESQGGLSSMTVLSNLTLSSMRRWRARSGLLRLTQERADAAAMAARLAVVPAGVDTTFGTLSGGNKQKVIFGRALLSDPDLYVLCEPTRGVDVQTRHEIYRLIVDVARRGAAVLVVSSDVEDLFAVCDRIGLVEGGRISTLRPATDSWISDLKVLL